uniref:ATP synthase subunit a n=1 Tax=Zeugodacus cucurbitae TaxID=28588 RepID=A0A0A1WT08_ZEUCU
MAKAFIILIISALMLLQVQAVPRMRRDTGSVAVQQKATNARSTGTSEKLKFRPRQLLMTTTLADLLGLAKYVTEHGRPLFNKTLAQLEAVPDKCDGLKANITRISEYLKTNANQGQSDAAEDMLSLFESMITLTSILQDANEMPPELEQTKTVQQAFIDNGSDKFEDDLMAELKVVSKKFEKAIEHYLSILTEDQKKEETKLIDWYTRFTNEKDDEKKAEFYSNFFDTFNP